MACEHDWQLVEVAVEADAADTTAVCTQCGEIGVQAGRGRGQRPALPEIELTLAEVRALRRGHEPE